MAVQRLAKGALRKGAPFAFLQGLFLLLALLPGTYAAACALDRGAESAAVDYVYDGDTLRLHDGRKVRFIGINTPEIKRDGAPSEPFSRAARKRVVELIGSAEIVLRFDGERHDHYGRVLAHPYLADGRSLSKLLLQEGLAAAVVLPPNLWHSDCYLQQEQTARAERRGIWSQPQVFIKHSTSLKRGDEGFALLQGRAEALQQSRNSLWLELDGNVALRIPRDDLHYFGEHTLRALVGRPLEARGWLTYYKGKWRMTVRHPNALQGR